MEHLHHYVEDVMRLRLLALFLVLTVAGVPQCLAVDGMSSEERQKMRDAETILKYQEEQRKRWESLTPEQQKAELKERERKNALDESLKVKIRSQARVWKNADGREFKARLVAVSPHRAWFAFGTKKSDVVERTRISLSTDDQFLIWKLAMATLKRSKIDWPEKDKKRPTGTVSFGN
jgi:hypothetical protein